MLELLSNKVLSIKFRISIRSFFLRWKLLFTNNKKKIFAYFRVNRFLYVHICRSGVPFYTQHRIFPAESLFLLCWSLFVLIFSMKCECESREWERKASICLGCLMKKFFWCAIPHYCSNNCSWALEMNFNVFMHLTTSIVVHVKHKAWNQLKMCN